MVVWVGHDIRKLPIWRRVWNTPTSLCALGLSKTPGASCQTCVRFQGRIFSTIDLLDFPESATGAVRFIAVATLQNGSALR